MLVAGVSENTIGLLAPKPEVSAAPPPGSDHSNRPEAHANTSKSPRLHSRDDNNPSPNFHVGDPVASTLGLFRCMTQSWISCSSYVSLDSLLIGKYHEIASMEECISASMEECISPTPILSEMPALLLVS